MLYVPGRLRAFRLTAGLSQAFVAEQIGVSASSVCRWEQGRERIPADHQEQLATLFGVAVSWLMGESWDSLDPETMLDAIGTLRRLHDELIGLAMVLTDLLGDVQEGRQAVNLQNMRRAAANTFRRQQAAREGAISMLVGETAVAR